MSKQGAYRGEAASRLVSLAPNASTFFSAIEQVVASIIYPDAAGPPTDLDKVGARLNVLAIKLAALPIDGYTEQTERGFTITVDSTASLGRRRFTIAHELGHVILDRGLPKPLKQTKLLEKVCDRLAASILMPEREFRAATEARRSLDDLMIVADLFGATITATARRFAELHRSYLFDIQDDRIIWSFPKVSTPTSFPETITVGKVVFYGTVDGIFSKWIIDTIRLDSDAHLLSLVYRK